jgi:hypothetical protein
VAALRSTHRPAFVHPYSLLLFGSDERDTVATTMQIIKSDDLFGCSGQGCRTYAVSSSRKGLGFCLKRAIFPQLLNSMHYSVTLSERQPNESNAHDD